MIPMNVKVVPAQPRNKKWLAVTKGGVIVSAGISTSATSPFTSETVSDKNYNID